MMLNWLIKICNQERIYWKVLARAVGDLIDGISITCTSTIEGHKKVIGASSLQEENNRLSLA
ncbi:MAG: hypothetical protein ACTXOO_05970 [Sodalis sp. (in: enterobacteria)]